MKVEMIKRNTIIIKKVGIKQDNMIHVTAVGCLNHIEEHGDISLLNNLLDALPRSGRLQGFVIWCVDHGKVDYVSQTNKFTYNKAKKTKTEGILPFWLYTKEVKPISPMDLDKRILSLLQAVEKVQKDESALAASRIDFKKVEQLRSMVV